MTLSVLADVPATDVVAIATPPCVAETPARYCTANIMALPVITDEQASTLAFFSQAGIYYCGRRGTNAFAEGSDLAGGIRRFIVAADGSFTTI